MQKLLKKLNHILDKHRHLLILLGLLLILRLPNFFEPYWYGDEGIYLTIGQAIRSGSKLYSEIIDHKTPIIYYLAAVPSQFHFRLLLTVWMLVTTTAFYYFSCFLLKSRKAVFISTLFFVLFTTLPWLEGNIPNGELFVMGFVIVGAWILTKTSLLNTDKKALTKPSNKELRQTFLAGVFFSLAILTKVPAVLDMAAFMALTWFLFWKNISREPIIQTIKKLTPWLTALIVGVIIPILVSIFYFISQGSGADYLNFGLLYNIRYSSYWQPPIDNNLILWLFTLPGKITSLGFLFIFLTLFGKYFKVSFQFIAGWLGLALLASLLSNRPYPHYFLQPIPPLALLIGLLTVPIFARITKKRRQLRSAMPTRIELAVSIALIFVFMQSIKLVGIDISYDWHYYQKFTKLATRQLSTQDYNQTFNHLMNDNYKVARIISDAGAKDLFIWGTNPMLYTLSGANPTGRFTVSFHIKDFQAFGESLESVRQKEPKFIVVMHDEEDSFPDFSEYLHKNYIPNYTFDHLTLYMRDISK